METPELPSPPVPATLPVTTVSKNEQSAAMLCHLLGLCGYVFPFGNIIGPLIVWVVKREQMPFVDREGKEALNFQLSMTIYHLVCIPLLFVFIGFLLLPVLAIVNLVLIILASIEAANGRSYRYPFTIRFLQ